MEYLQMLITISSLGMFFAGVYIGKIIERIRWNQLIDKGVLPHPQQG